MYGRGLNLALYRYLHLHHVQEFMCMRLEVRFVNAETKLASGELVPGLSWVQLKGMRTNERTVWDSNDGLLLWSRDLKQLKFGVDFIGNRGVAY